MRCLAVISTYPERETDRQTDEETDREGVHKRDRETHRGRQRRRELHGGREETHVSRSAALSMYVASKVLKWTCLLFV